MKKIFIFILVVVFALFLKIDVFANSINSIKMDIYIDNYGNAHVTEVWDAYSNKGTEFYRTYTDLDGVYISDFTVRDNTTHYETLSFWNLTASFNSKAYKAGINRISDGVELCFGISKYGSNTYTLSYIINGFVFSATDSDIIYWQFVNQDLAKLTNNVYIKIYADNRFSDDLDVWGYGNYGGYAYVYDGYIEISNNNLKENQYMVGLIKFPKDTFNSSNIKYNDFDYYYQMAKKGSKKYIDFEAIIFLLISFLILGLPIFIIIVSANKQSNNHGSYKLHFGKDGKKLPKEVNMFRDIPCNKDLFRAYWVADNYGLMSKQTDFLGAILLKWLKQKHIEIRNNSNGKIFKKGETSFVFPISSPNLDTELEKTLYNYMYTASKDGILESKEFEKWCKSNYKKMLKWFDNALDYESKLLIDEGMITKETKKVFLVNTTVYTVNQKMKEEAIQMKGLKKFFRYFSNMEDKETIEVMFWEEYLMYAQILGVADKVAKQLKKIYPDVITDYTYESITFVRNISYSGVSSANSARSRAISYSSGGGGFSSGGGGGGSFGGGGGGFR